MRGARRALAVLGAFLAAHPAAAGTSSSAYHFALGKLLAAEGSNAAALTAFESALAAADDAYLRAELAEFLLRLDRIEEARTHATRAVELAPGNVDALRLAAQVELARAERDPAAMGDAVAAFERVRAVAPRDLRTMIALGQLYLTQGRSKDAAAVLEEVARYRPNHPLVASFLVDALVKAGELAKAEKVLSDALAIAPDKVETRLALADLQSRRGDHRAAAATLQAAPLGQDSPELRRRLALELYRSGDLDAALRHADALVAEEGATPARYLRALVLLSLGRNDEAGAELSRLLDVAPTSVEVVEAMAEVLERQGKPEQAAALLDRLGRQLREESGRRGDGPPPEVTRVRLLQATVLLRAERAAEAEAVLRDALGAVASAGEPLLAETTDLLVEALVEQDRVADALAELDAFERRAGLLAVDLRARRAELLLRLGRDEEARPIVEAMTATPDPEAVIAAARAYQRIDRHAEAVPILQQFLAKHPDAVRVSFALGSALERSGQRAAAIATFRELVTRQPDFAPALNYLGYMWAERGENLDEALRLIERAVASDPDNGAYVDSLGWAHFQRREYDRARVHLERAARLIPDDATIYEHLGDLYLALGERALARQVYERAVELAADNQADVRRKLEKLR